MTQRFTLLRFFAQFFFERLTDLHIGSLSSADLLTVGAVLFLSESALWDALGQVAEGVIGKFFTDN
jgi:hypothetical protein